MTIDEAKICLSIQVEVKHRLGKDYEAKALQLGLEALSRIQAYREVKLSDDYFKLPGETKD